METYYSCLIVEDEKPAHEVLKSHIKKLPQLQFAKSVYNGKEAYDILQSQQFDIVFLDIEMPIISGIELLRELHPKPAIIMTTAYTDFAFEAYQHDAVDYLQKPISFLRFSKAIEKAIQYCNQKKHAENKITEITIKADGEKIIILLSEIIYIASMGNYIKLVVGNQKKPLVVYDTLSKIYDKLDKNQFVQIHKSYIININCIAEKNGEIVKLTNREELPIGRKYSVLLKK
jgi:DNA-binding LytR/AlgR family response regulator